MANYSLDDLRKLASLKSAYETGDATAKTNASAEATKLRSAYGVDKDTMTLADVNAQIKQRETAQAPQVNPNIQALAEAQKAKAAASLGQAYQKSLGTLGQEEANINPQYEAQRTSARTANTMQQKQYDDYLAQRGIANSGSAAQGMLQQSSALQGQLGSSQLQQRKALEDVARRRTQLGSDYEFGLANAQSDADIQAMTQLINQANQDRQFGLQEAGLTGTYNGGQTLAAQGQTFNQGLQTKQLGLQEQGQQFNQALQQKQFDQAVSQFQQQFGLNLRQQSFSEAQAAVQNAISRGQLSVSQGNLALQQAKFAADNDPNSFDNQMKKALYEEQLKGAQLGNTNQELQNQGLQQSLTSTPTVNTKPYQDLINTRFMGTDNLGRQTFDEQGIRAYLESLSASGMDDNTVLGLASIYGIQPIQNYNTDTYRLNN